MIVPVMLSTAALAETAALIGDPTRANMLAALMDGRALTARELADVAGVTAQTASGHLAQLTSAGLLAMQRQGRYRYHRLVSPAVAHMLESIMSVAAGRAAGEGRIRVRRVGPRDAALRHARTCYDHLAGQLAVAMADRMTERGQIELSPDGGAITETGTCFLRGLGVDLDATSARVGRRGGARVFCRPCLDWSERRSHIAGGLGAALCTACFARAGSVASKGHAPLPSRRSAGWSSTRPSTCAAPSSDPAPAKGGERSYDEALFANHSRASRWSKLVSRA
jgi:DNA-binding transcriptional ArsR family regulator